jgi:hypothetical protein
VSVLEESEQGWREPYVDVVLREVPVEVFDSEFGFGWWWLSAKL